MINKKQLFYNKKIYIMVFVASNCTNTYINNIFVKVSFIDVWFSKNAEY